MMEDIRHIPVLPEETLHWLLPHSSCAVRIIDGTLGYGGHSQRILERCSQAELLGIDRDLSALAYSRERLSFASDRIKLYHGTFSEMKQFADDAGWTGVDGILLDIGVSSPQIDDPERGFSWKGNGPLDMRMNRESGRTAADILRDSDERTLTSIFRDYGGIAEAKKLAHAIVVRRETKPFERCQELTALCDEILPRFNRSGPPSPTLPFQALRIAVNDELGELQRALDAAIGLLNPGGRLCVISFHSLEDRIVKHFFQEMAVSCKCPPGCPVCICGWSPKLKILTKKPVEAGMEERARNSRSSCARLRVAERLPEQESKEH